MSYVQMNLRYTLFLTLVLIAIQLFWQVSSNKDLTSFQVFSQLITLGQMNQTKLKHLVYDISAWNN